MARGASRLLGKGWARAFPTLGPLARLYRSRTRRRELGILIGPTVPVCHSGDVLPELSDRFFRLGIEPFGSAGFCGAPRRLPDGRLSLVRASPGCVAHLAEQLEVLDVEVVEVCQFLHGILGLLPQLPEQIARSNRRLPVRAERLDDGFQLQVELGGVPDELGR
ncbi:MAG: hypothetical protein HY319_07570 [Armatimonadetes bacterium]|nr:hypothetical protein [Armatimonadota bacterium]